jgi:heme/copper-type cytochrome/quinol oxidase subunit 3
MAHAPAAPTSTPDELATHATPAAVTAVQHPPVSPGKVAMWLFLATEVMFFTGLIGSYIVLRSGSPPTAYSNLYAPGTDLTRLEDTKGVHLDADPGHNPRVAEILHAEAGMTEEEVHHALEHVPGLVVRGVPKEKAARIVEQLEAAGAKAGVEDLKTYNWPLPYDHNTNPLDIDLTALNTFILICSSVTMVLALSAVQRGDQFKFKLFLAATAVIGSCFLGVQVYEYRALMFGHYYPVGIGATHHFRPSVSLFASCFFTMTGFHGAHVAGGVILLTIMFIGSLLGRFSASHYSPIELAGLYWHFVDLVWIILFTVVYLL